MKSYHALAQKQHALTPVLFTIKLNKVGKDNSKVEGGARMAPLYRMRSADPADELLNNRISYGAGSAKRFHPSCEHANIS